MRGNTTLIVVRAVRTHGYVLDISMLISAAIENAFMLMMMAHFTSWAKRVCVFCLKITHFTGYLCNMLPQKLDVFVLCDVVNHWCSPTKGICFNFGYRQIADLVSEGFIRCDAEGTLHLGQNRSEVRNYD